MKGLTKKFCWSLGLLVLPVMFASLSLAKDPGYTVAGTIVVQKTGTIWLGMKSELEEKRGQDPSFGAEIKVAQEDVRQGRVSFSMQDVPEGVYAIQCYQDTNGNGKMDFGIFGIPLEPWGNYRDVRPKFRGPKFNEISFIVDRDITDIAFRLKK